MEIKTIRYDDSTATVTLHSIENITEIEKGSLFGIITSKFDMDVVSPLVDFGEDGDLSYSLTSLQDLIPEDFEINSDVLSGGESLPLIFKKLDDNLAQEVLSGEIFTIVGKDKKKDADDIDRYLNIEQFQKGIAKYSNNNVIMYSEAEEFMSEDRLSGIFVVDDMFKSLYSDETLSKKDEVIKALRSIKEQAKKYFETEFKQCINLIQSVAETDNLIYDIEHSDIESKPKSI